MDVSQKRKIFSEFFLHFLNLDSIFNSLKKKMTLIAYDFFNLRTPKHVVRSTPRKRPFRASFDK